MTPDVQDLLDRWPMGRRFNLRPGATVAIVGSYQGIVMDALDQLYHPAVIVGFDPQEWACARAAQRLAGRTNCLVVSTGLGLRNETLPMGEWGTDACSLIHVGPDSRVQGEGVFVDAAPLLSYLFPDGIDLMVMNIEGYEFELLPYLAANGWLPRIGQLAVQFHIHRPGDEAAADGIRALLDETHVVAEDMYPAWIHWVPRV